MSAAGEVEGPASLVRVEPAGLEISVRPGESVMAAAERLGYRWPSVCGGLGECATCISHVRQGADQLSAPGRDEIRVLTDFFCKAPPEYLRLSCQLTVAGPGVVLRRTGIRRPPADK